VRVDAAQTDIERCRRENVVGPATLAAACAGRQLPFMTFSSDLVFDGLQRAPYVESDAVNPLNEYGRTKAEAERAVLAVWRQAVVIRTSALFGPWDEYNFVTLLLRALARGQTFEAAPTVVSPTYVPDLIHACLDLVIDGACGVWHVAGAGAVSWAELAFAAAGQAGCQSSLIDVRPPASGLAPRPAYSALASERAQLLPPWDRALNRYFSERIVALA
jgi:dTDP-4-dehydrorhamnose reductase